jgi:hypothetical protein
LEISLAASRRIVRRPGKAMSDRFHGAQIREDYFSKLQLGMEIAQ